MQDEFRGLDASAFVAMDLASHFKELSRSKEGNLALDILVFIRVSISEWLNACHFYDAVEEKELAIEVDTGSCGI